MLRVIDVSPAFREAFRTWLNDDSTDMGRTMAALDKALRRKGALAEVLWCGRLSYYEQPIRDMARREAPMHPQGYFVHCKIKLDATVQRD